MPDAGDDFQLVSDFTPAAIPLPQSLHHSAELQDSDILSHHTRFAHAKPPTLYYGGPLQPLSQQFQRPPCYLSTVSHARSKGEWRAHVCYVCNPGLLEFYISFLSAVWEQCSSSNFAILAHAPIGHTPGIDDDSHRPDPGIVGLTSQVDAILEVITAIRSTFGPSPKLVLVGHSIGSWLLLQALKNLPTREISATFLLFPTISQIARTPNGRRLSVRPVQASSAYPRYPEDAPIILLVVVHSPYATTCILSFCTRSLASTSCSLRAISGLAHGSIFCTKKPNLHSARHLFSSYYGR